MYTKYHLAVSNNEVIIIAFRAPPPILYSSSSMQRCALKFEQFDSNRILDTELKLLSAQSTNKVSPRLIS